MVQAVREKSEIRSEMLSVLPLHSVLHVLPSAEGKSVLKEVGKHGVGRSWSMAGTADPAPALFNIG